MCGGGRLNIFVSDLCRGYNANLVNLRLAFLSQILGQPMSGKFPKNGVGGGGVDRWVLQTGI